MFWKMFEPIESRKSFASLLFLKGVTEPLTGVLKKHDVTIVIIVINHWSPYNNSSRPRRYRFDLRWYCRQTSRQNLFCQFILSCYITETGRASNTTFFMFYPAGCDPSILFLPIVVTGTPLLNEPRFYILTIKRFPIFPKEVRQSYYFISFPMVLKRKLFYRIAKSFQIVITCRKDKFVPTQIKLGEVFYLVPSSL